MQCQNTNFILALHGPPKNFSLEVSILYTRYSVANFDTYMDFLKLIISLQRSALRLTVFEFKKKVDMRRKG
jgi:hypothetical protein